MPHLHPVVAALRSAIASALPAIGLLAIAAAAHAQTGTLAGRAINAANGAPLGGVQIRLVGTVQGAITRDDGTYRVQVAPGSYTVRAMRIGYATATDSVVIDAGQTVTRDFALAEMLLNLDQVVVTGSRSTDRTVLEAPVAIDVISSAEIRSTGLTETSQIIQMLAPSLNFPRPSVNDGTDHVRPATLRGLGPDQTLVLINGKRRHTTALVHVNQSVGRGSTSVDLNAIPAASIERIEILRDGAAAQYGSDAIAGVINIILKSSEQTSVSATYGQVRSSPRKGAEYRDGAVRQFDANFGRLFRSDGFFHLSGEFRDRERTNRARVDITPQCIAGSTTCSEIPTGSSIYDENLRQSWSGDAETQDWVAFLNSELPLDNGIRLYGFGGFGQREGTAAGFFRRSSDARTVRERYPNGFLPLITSDITDGSGAIGAKGSWRDWNWDLGGVYGGNSFAFGVENSINTSLGVDSPTSFDAGTLGFTQGTLNFDVAHLFPESPLGAINVAMGVEARRDSYRIERGDPNSYAVGTVPVLDGPDEGLTAQPFAQVFPGFRPEDEVDNSRTNYGIYGELEATPWSPLLISIAARAEDYSDFGSTTDGKIAARLELGPGVAIRGAAQTGFRAPSLAQSHFSSVATNFVIVSGVSTPFEIRTFSVNSPGARLLGAKALRPEESKNLSVGLTMRPFPSLSLSTDYYFVAIDDRIVLSGNFTGQAVVDRLATIDITGVSGARYFTNAVDTETEGLDVVLNYGLDLGRAGFTRFTGGYNRNRTIVTHADSTPPELALAGSVLFDRVQRTLIQRGQPRSSVSLTLNHQVGAFAANVHASRFGEITVAQSTAANDQTFGRKWITDLSLSYRFLDRLSLGVGGNNIFDVYPDTLITPNQTRGIYLYSGASPFGFNGSYYYVRAAYDFDGLSNPFRRSAPVAEKPRAMPAIQPVPKR
jgi:iron complex outermembrane receptor protein